MNERGQKPKHTLARHIQAVRLWRFRRIARTIPASLSAAERGQHRLRAFQLCMSLSNREIVRVVWPWQARPVSPEADPSVRVARGRVR